MNNYIVSLVFDLEGVENAHSLDINGTGIHFYVSADSYAEATKIVSKEITDYENRGITFEYVKISGYK